MHGNKCPGKRVSHILSSLKKEEFVTLVYSTTISPSLSMEGYRLQSKAFFKETTTVFVVGVLLGANVWRDFFGRETVDSCVVGLVQKMSVIKNAIRALLGMSPWNIYVMLWFLPSIEIFEIPTDLVIANKICRLFITFVK